MYTLKIKIIKKLCKCYQRFLVLRKKIFIDSVVFEDTENGTEINVTGVTSIVDNTIDEEIYNYNKRFLLSDDNIGGELVESISEGLYERLFIQ